MLSELDDYYAMPSYVKYGFEVIKDRRPGIPIFGMSQASSFLYPRPLIYSF